MIRLNNIHIEISKGLVRLWLALLVAAVASLADVADFTVRSVGTALSADTTGTETVPLVACAMLSLAVLKATALTALYAACLSNRWLKAVAVAVIVAFVMLSLLNGFCWLFYGFGISMKLFKIMAETNPAEVGEFLPELVDKLTATFRSIWLWVFILLFAAAWKWLPRVSARWLMGVSLTLSVFGLAYLVWVFVTAEFGRNAHSVFIRSGRCVAKYIGDRAVIRDLQAKKRPLEYPETLISSHAAERIVVVIGESASRDHLSLYGYPLQTTPRLDSIRSDLYVFRDAVASSAATAENMPRLLTLMTDEPGDKEWYDFPSVLQLFRQLGYRTYWLSNQEYSGQWSNLSTILALDADVLKYVGNMESDEHFLYRYDDALLPEFRKSLAAGDSLQLTFLHLMGSHFQYDRRFPESRARFSVDYVIAKTPRKWLDVEKAGIIANYDNSILYSDSILSQVIEGVRRQRQPAVMIYLSDHGENVYDDRDYRGRDTKFVDVPFLIYANEAYRRKNPDMMKLIEDAGSVAFSTSELPQMLMRLSGTRYQMYDSVRDPLSPAFRMRKRWVDEEVFYRDKTP
ncbi:MAG: phosphoethanolamine transferase [Muribaculaceae bacterium]|nr:phosphoethanolamine transferase [Muribaculaceae bacterium]